MYQIKIHVRITEWFAFVIGEEIDESAKVVPENNKTSLHTLLLMLFFTLTKRSNTQAHCEILHGFNYKFHSVQQSLN